MVQVTGVQAAPKFRKASSVGSSLHTIRSAPGRTHTSSVSVVSSIAAEEGNAAWGDDLDLSGDD